MTFLSGSKPNRKLRNLSEPLLQQKMFLAEGDDPGLRSRFETGFLGLTIPETLLATADELIQ
jgi:hypothetical protein